DATTTRVVYRGLDGSAHERYLPAGGRWLDRRMVDGAPPSDGDPFGYTTPFEGADAQVTARVVYRADGKIYEITRTRDRPWGAAADLTAQVRGAPSALGDPVAYVTNGIGGDAPNP